MSRTILVIGIGAGDPEYVTVQAVAAMNEAEVFFVVDKGADKSQLVALRQEVCERFITDQSAYRVVEIPDPPRDRGAAAYEGAVADWHERRAILFEQAIAEHLAQDGCGAFLVWGDPALYDSTLRVIDRILARGVVDFDYRVIPGITSVQALAARHRLPLNLTGEPVHITTGRRLAAGLPDELESAVIMLDAGLACKDFDDPDLHIYWGAYLGTPDEVLMSGRLIEVAASIDRAKRELKARHGWIMDTYLLRREPSHGLVTEEMTANALQPLGDHEALVPELFGIWSAGSEPELAAQAWDALHRQGLIDVETDVGRAVSVCRLATFAALYREFCARSGEGCVDDWRHAGWDLVGAYPRIDPITFGRIAERFALRPHELTEWQESPDGLLQGFIEAEHTKVTKALRNELGDAGLFASMWWARSREWPYPLTDEAIREAVNYSVQEGLMAWEWLTDGMSLR